MPCFRPCCCEFNPCRLPPSLAPPAPLQVRCSLPHLEALYADDPLWDLSAPRAACEAYIAAGEERCAGSVQTGAYTQVVDSRSKACTELPRSSSRSPAQASCILPCPTLQSVMSWGWTGQPTHSSCGA